jgi:ABC-2 type transport system ATP-binding protein
MLAVETHDLCKAYGTLQVLHDLRLRVPEGSLFGFLGPNGAGKTTTLRILLGLLRATRGRASVLGQDAWDAGPRLRREVGYLPGDPRFYEGMTGRDMLRFFDRARGGGAAAEMGRLIERLALDPLKRVRDYSKGNKQKLGLIQAMMHRPRLLLLDEPTNALDPLVRQTLIEELRAVVADGRTVLFSSHTLSEVEELCDRVLILREGRIIEDDTVDGLRKRAVRRVEVAFREPCRTAPPAGLHVARQDDHLLTGSWVGELGPLLDWLAQLRPRDVSISTPSLEDLFLAYYNSGTAPERAAPERTAAAGATS